MSDKKYNQIVFLSGKGGTGKTTFAASFAKIIEEKIVIDCDVDAANLYLLLKPKKNKESKFIGGKKAEIDELKCSGCGLCEEVCRFDAIKNFKIDPFGCEGCGFCVRVCPDNAISFEPNVSGTFSEGKLEDKSIFFQARLHPGEGNSGKLVSEIKKQALNNINEKTEWIIIDGPPGIGCPVNASLAGSDFIVLIAEPTLSGLHDLRRLIELLRRFKLPYGIIINKYDINEGITAVITELANRSETTLLGKIAFNPDFVHSLQLGKTIIEYNSEIKTQIEEIWAKIKFQIKTLKN